MSPANVNVPPLLNVSLSPASAASVNEVEIAAVPAAVNLPCWSTVNVAIFVASPYAPGVTAVSAIPTVTSPEAPSPASNSNPVPAETPVMSPTFVVYPNDSILSLIAADVIKVVSLSAKASALVVIEFALKLSISKFAGSATLLTA